MVLLFVEIEMGLTVFCFGMDGSALQDALSYGLAWFFVQRVYASSRSQ